MKVFFKTNLGGGEENRTCVAVRLVEDVRLICGPLNTGLTIL